MNQREMNIMSTSDIVKERLGYAYVPVQRISKVYPPAKALQQGTVFPELDIGIEEYERGLWNGK